MRNWKFKTKIKRALPKAQIVTLSPEPKHLALLGEIFDEQELYIYDSKSLQSLLNICEQFNQIPPYLNQAKYILDMIKLSVGAYAFTERSPLVVLRLRQSEYDISLGDYASFLDKVLKGLASEPSNNNPSYSNPFTRVVNNVYEFVHQFFVNYFLTSTVYLPKQWQNDQELLNKLKDQKQKRQDWIKLNSIEPQNTTSSFVGHDCEVEYLLFEHFECKKIDLGKIYKKIEEFIALVLKEYLAEPQTSDLQSFKLIVRELATLLRGKHRTGNGHKKSELKTQKLKNPLKELEKNYDKVEIIAKFFALPLQLKQESWLIPCSETTSSTSLATSYAKRNALRLVLPKAYNYPDLVTTKSIGQVYDIFIKIKNKDSSQLFFFINWGQNKVNATLEGQTPEVYYIDRLIPPHPKEASNYSEQEKLELVKIFSCLKVHFQENDDAYSKMHPLTWIFEEGQDQLRAQKQNSDFKVKPHNQLRLSNDNKFWKFVNYLLGKEIREIIAESIQRVEASRIFVRGCLQYGLFTVEHVLTFALLIKFYSFRYNLELSRALEPVRKFSGYEVDNRFTIPFTLNPKYIHSMQSSEIMQFMLVTGHTSENVKACQQVSRLNHRLTKIWQEEENFLEKFLQELDVTKLLETCNDFSLDDLTRNSEDFMDVLHQNNWIKLEHGYSHYDYMSYTMSLLYSANQVRMYNLHDEGIILSSKAHALYPQFVKDVSFAEYSNLLTFRNKRVFLKMRRSFFSRCYMYLAAGDIERLNSTLKLVYRLDLYKALDIDFKLVVNGTNVEVKSCKKAKETSYNQFVTVLKSRNTDPEAPFKRKLQEVRDFYCSFVYSLISVGLFFTPRDSVHNKELEQVYYLASQFTQMVIETEYAAYRSVKSKR
ncbi:hypothetical protein CJP74_02635 [Psittacicella melopsittaci]|uniref:Uncharacterized protein n=1 Tax=Psittacicella melopsittaci TaxID=2028576 RepID=A0A3A1Y6M7_9GAMM|nr:hypothetical protein [Psittacicella melopsittaci]RIY33171.1 hypothetical protein CJP74_02635 [Psittacicella melopsittaci]